MIFSRKVFESWEKVMIHKNEGKMLENITTNREGGDQKTKWEHATIEQILSKVRKLSRPQCSLEWSRRYFIYYSKKDCAGERDSGITEKLSDGDHLKVRVKGGEVVTELNFLIIMKITGLWNNSDRAVAWTVRSMVHAIIALSERIEIVARGADQQSYKYGKWNIVSLEILARNTCLGFV